MVECLLLVLEIQIGCGGVHSRTLFFLELIGSVWDYLSIGSFNFHAIVLVLFFSSINNLAYQLL